ncbi:MAG: nuclear transport factor 2 family protein [Syntrophales bacterium]
MTLQQLFRIMIIVVLAIAVSTSALANDKSRNVAQEIQALDMAWGEAAAKGDGAALNKLLADDLYHVHASGNIEDKTAYINSLVSGKRKHAPIVPQQVRVRVYGDTAVSTGKFKMVAYKEGLAKPMVDQVNLYTHIWQKTPHGWRLVVHQATAEGGMTMPSGMNHGGMDRGAKGQGAMDHDRMNTVK